MLPGGASKCCELPCDASIWSEGPSVAHAASARCPLRAGVPLLRTEDEVRELVSLESEAEKQRAGMAELSQQTAALRAQVMAYSCSVPVGNPLLQLCTR